MANTTIQLKHSTLTGNVPSSLANGEISINNRDGKFFYSTPAGVVVTHYPYLGPAGLNQEIQFNDSGVLGSDSGLTYNKTTDVITIVGGAIVGGINVVPYLISAFTQANTPSYTANSAASYANSAFAAANSGSGSSSAGPYANAAFSTANSAASYANAAFDKANTATSGANSFGVIYTSNNNTFANSTAPNSQLNFVGESGVVVYANSSTKTITVAGTPGAQGLTVDYGFVAEPTYYSIDYGSLA